MYKNGISAYKETWAKDGVAIETLHLGTNTSEQSNFWYTLFNKHPEKKDMYIAYFEWNVHNYTAPRKQIYNENPASRQNDESGGNDLDISDFGEYTGDGKSKLTDALYPKAKQAVIYFRDHANLTALQAVGFVGHLIGESGLGTTTESKSGAIGVAQWSGSGGRATLV